MFWSLLLEPGKRYTKVVDSPFHISAAVLDTTTQDHGIVRVIVDIGDAEAHIANLSIKHGILQSPLDLQFESGSRISFYTTGAKSNVHLSGYVMFEEEELLSDQEDDSSEEEVPTLVTAPVKRKPEDSPAAGNKKAKMQKVTPATPNSTAAATAAAAAKASPSKPAKGNTVPNKVEKMDSEDDEEEDGLDDSDDEEEEEEEEEDDEGEEEEDEDDESDDEEEDDEIQMMEVTKQKQIKKENAVKPGQFPTKEPVNIFKMEKIPKSAKTPVNDAKTAKGEKKTPKGAMTQSGEGTKTPKGAKTPGGEGAKTPKGTKTPGGEGGAPDKGKKTPSKQQGATAAATPTQNGKTPKAETPAKNTAKSPQTPKTVKQGGVVCEDLMVGKGPEAKGGKMVSVYYEGRLVSNKKMFDKCDSGKGFKFRLGGGEVIKGWDVGVAGMRIGGKRKITCPPHMAYGKKGAPPDIPGNAALSFVVELKGIN